MKDPREDGWSEGGFHRGSGDTFQVQRAIDRRDAVLAPMFDGSPASRAYYCLEMAIQTEGLHAGEETFYVSETMRELRRRMTDGEVEAADAGAAEWAKDAAKEKDDA